MNKIIINLLGAVNDSTSPCLPGGYGYYAYVSSNSPMIKWMFDSMSIWIGPTDSFATENGEYWDQFEIDCRNKSIFYTPFFQKICARVQIDLQICDSEENRKPLLDLFESRKGR